MGNKSEFKVGDLVWAKPYASGHLEGYGIIREIPNINATPRANGKFYMVKMIGSFHRFHLRLNQIRATTELERLIYG